MASPTSSSTSRRPKLDHCGKSARNDLTRKSATPISTPESEVMLWKELQKDSNAARSGTCKDQLHTIADTLCGSARMPLVTDEGG